ncbi:MAG: MBL fold metallo-hydrolase, partial [Candidatus Hodarchaeota archaeon]
MDQLKITFLGQSCFRLQSGSSTLLLDPGRQQLGDISGDIVFASHHHSDHTKGVEIFLKRNPEAIFVCNEQVADHFKEWRNRIVFAAPGEEVTHASWRLSFVGGRHGLFSGVLNTGIIIRASSLSFGHAGDTVDFQEFSHEQLDLLAIPIGGIFTASPKRALKELKSFSKPLPIIIPMHWLWRKPRGFCQQFCAT